MFSKTQTLQAFAYANGITSVEKVLNPNSGKKFIATNTDITMRVSDKVNDDLQGQNYSVSWFTPEDGGEPSWMLHLTGTANVLGSLSFAPAPVAARVVDFEHAI
jgi:hypothetical protein